MAKNPTPTNIGTYNAIVIISCIVGILLSAYAFHVEVASEKDQDYEALCDISEHMSCTKVFKSEYGKGFGIVGKYLGEDSPLNVPNGSLGAIFYTIFLMMTLSNSITVSKCQLVVSIVSNLSSIYLAYILYFILSDFCVVCVSTYVVNIVNTVFIYNKVKSLKQKQSKKKKMN